MQSTRIRIINAAIDDAPTAPARVVLRGVIDPISIPNLKVDLGYQRVEGLAKQRNGSQPVPVSMTMAIPGKKGRELFAHLEAGGLVPDLQLAMRSSDYDDSPKEPNVVYLSQDVFIMDGLQRTCAALKVIDAGKSPRLGVTVVFDTSFEYEHKTFDALNTTATRLSPNILLRNACEYNPALSMLKSLCMDSTFAMYNRVAWGQKMKRGELVTAATLLKVVTRLHTNFGTGLKTSGRDLRVNFDRMMDLIGRTTIRNNCKTFFELIDDCWGIRNIEYAGPITQMRGNFLMCMARLLSMHSDFWEDQKLVIPPHLRKKLSGFKLTDPRVADLCKGAGSYAPILLNIVIQYVNSGKRTKRLTEIVPKENVTGTKLYPDDDLESETVSAFPETLPGLVSGTKGFESRV